MSGRAFVDKYINMPMLDWYRCSKVDYILFLAT
jgi:hypothetical protein